MIATMSQWLSFNTGRFSILCVQDVLFHHLATSSLFAVLSFMAFCDIIKRKSVVLGTHLVLYHEHADVRMKQNKKLTKYLGIWEDFLDWLQQFRFIVEALWILVDQMHFVVCGNCVFAQTNLLTLFFH